jgi:predicted DNA-binding transcriptional regulator YafY
MNRLDRLTSMLIQLQSKRVVKAQDLAERFGISLRSVYRDIRSLEEAGVPLVGEAGVGYSIMEGYRLPPVMFTADEATAFITAEKLIENLTDPHTADQYKSALYKIKSVLRSDEKAHIEVLDEQISVLTNPYLPETKQAALQPMLHAIARKQVLHIEYSTIYSEQKTTRDVEPVGVFFMSNNWYLIAWCRLRNDYRSFRTDHIRSLFLKDLAFDKKHVTLKEYLKKYSKEREMKLTEVKIAVQSDRVAHLGEQKFYHGFISQQEKNGMTELTFMVSSLEGIARWYMMFGDVGRIISPPSLKKRVAEIMKGTAANMNT